MKKKVLKKNNKEFLKQSKSNYEGDPTKIIYIVVGVVLTFCATYLLFAWLKGDFKKEESKEDETPEVVIQNKEILYGSVFNKLDTEYLVLFYNMEDKEVEIFDAIVEKYRGLKKLPIYVVDLDNQLNKAILVGEGEKSNTKPTKANNLKVTSPTLIRIKSGKVTKYVEEKEAIKTYFEGISK